MRKLIFLVEDEADISRLVRHHLEQTGFAVRTFASTMHVLREAEEARPSLFLLDIMVPGGDGLDLCLRMRLNPSVGMTAVILLPARTAEAARVLGLVHGADDYIRKRLRP